jgi:hypothetical protein
VVIIAEKPGQLCSWGLSLWTTALKRGHSAVGDNGFWPSLYADGWDDLDFFSRAFFFSAPRLAFFSAFIRSRALRSK